jgi:phosphoribosylanthranilate isomerase
MAPIIKICGLTGSDALAAAAEAGATHVGFMFFEKSPRHVTLEKARLLAPTVPMSLTTVAVLVDPTDAELLENVRAIEAEAIQLHGSETPERVAAIKALTGLQIIKVLPVATKADVAAAAAYDAADLILFDAKAPADAARPGGNGIAFDWSLLSGLDLGKPWILSGGLNPDNVAAAIKKTGAPGVDVSSGVEHAPGAKDLQKIAAFVSAASSAYGLSETP